MLINNEELRTRHLVIRACIGMAYPPEDPDSRKGKIIRETMKDVPKGTQPSRIIHSDIDIYNCKFALWIYTPKRQVS